MNYSDFSFYPFIGKMAYGCYNGNMITEYSAGAVIFYREGEMISYLLLQYRHHRWDFPRGHLEAGEDEQEAARREIYEETHLDQLTYVPGFKIVTPWSYRRAGDAEKHEKVVTNFLAESRTKHVVLDEENLGFQWVTYEEAILLPMFPHVKIILDAAHRFLQGSR